MVTLQKITAENLSEVLNLKISATQEAFVSTPAHSLAQAFVSRDTAFPFAICAGNTVVGFLMLGYYDVKNQYTLWKFLIDEQYQGKGYGKAALKLAIEYLSRTFHVREVFLGVAFENYAAQKLYRSFGFTETGDRDDFQLEMKLEISAPTLCASSYPDTTCIRQATAADAVRLAEIEIFNYRLNFYPIFKNDSYYFDELQTNTLAQTYRDEPQLLDHTFVYDDGVVKGFFRVDGARLCKLFVEPVLQGGGIGGQLLEYAVQNLGADHLWALEKNRRAIRFYQRHGFALTGEKQPEEGTTELLVRLARPKEG